MGDSMKRGGILRDNYGALRAGVRAVRALYTSYTRPHAVFE